MTKLVSNNLKEIIDLCKRNHVEKLYLFGSAVDGNFSEQSDVDFTVIFEEDLSPKIYADSFWALFYGLKEILQIEVDLVVEDSIRNPVLRESIDSEKVMLYEKRDTRMAS